MALVTEGDLIIKDIKLQYPTYIHLLDGFIMYPPSTTRFEHELKKAVAATVGDVMTPQPHTVQADASVEDLATLMVDEGVSRMPVIDGDELVGIVDEVVELLGIGVALDELVASFADHEDRRDCQARRHSLRG